jgi:hypothetical protein
LFDLEKNKPIFVDTKTFIALSKEEIWE